MTSPTAQYLVRELASRMGEFYLSSPTSGSTFQLTDPQIIQFAPADVPFNAATGQGPMWWAYGPADADSGNRGQERRVRSYVANTGVATFFSAWPMNITTGHMEFHFRTPRSRKLEAINSGVRYLGFQWYRPVAGGAITTVEKQWRYALPPSIIWRKVSKIQLQITTDPTLVGFPYQDLTPYDYEIYADVDQTTGVTTYYLQFATMPPPNRTIRIFGEAEYADLVADTDIVPIPEKIQGRAIELIYEFAQARLYEWETNRQPQGEDDRYFRHMQERLQRAKEELLRYAPGPKPWRVVIPGQGTAEIGASDVGYFAGFSTLH